MRHHIDELIRIVDDAKVKTPIVIEASLPYVSLFIILLGTKRGMAKVANKKFQLLVRRFLDGQWSVDVRTLELARRDSAHAKVF